MVGKMKSLIVIAALATVAAFFVVGLSIAQQGGLTQMELLGQFLYFDENLSEPAGQSCASCHHPDFGFVDVATVEVLLQQLG